MSLPSLFSTSSLLLRDYEGIETKTSFELVLPTEHCSLLLRDYDDLFFMILDKIRYFCESTFGDKMIIRRITNNE